MATIVSDIHMNTFSSVEHRLVSMDIECVNRKTFSLLDKCCLCIYDSKVSNLMTGTKMVVYGVNNS